MAARQPEWVSDNFRYYQFNHTAQFGKASSKRDPYTGVSSTEAGFEPLFTLHYARRNQTISDRYQAAGTRYESTILITIRHNKELSDLDVVYVKIDGDLYKCINYSPNNDTWNAVDLLTLTKVEKVG